jgi:ssDNA-binding Zn-finger/Zn-ribbon topoisomerase 1
LSWNVVELTTEHLYAETLDVRAMVMLKIPYGFDSMGKVHTPESATKEDTYYCPSCADALVLRKGEFKVAHFAHKATDSCSLETITHRVAKRLIVHAIDEWKGGLAPSPIIVRRCEDCQSTIEQSIPERVMHAREEVKLESGFIADVVIYDVANAVAAIEVRVSHAVDDRKKGALGIPFIEVAGSDVVVDHRRWLPLVDRFKSFSCRTCRDALGSYRAEIERISSVSGVPLPTAYYRSACTDCWRCQKEILVFDWPGKDMHNDVPPRGANRPRTVQLKYSKTAGGKYWANTCPYCKSIQGDFFLYSEPDGPFFGFTSGPDRSDQFDRDIKRLALLNRSK